MLRESFGNQSETCLIMGSTVDSALASLMERRHLDDLIIDRLAMIVDTKNTLHMMTNILGNQAFIAAITRFVKRNTQKVLVEFKALA